jgi:hypothetical protein
MDQRVYLSTNDTPRDLVGIKKMGPDNDKTMMPISSSTKLGNRKGTRVCFVFQFQFCYLNGQVLVAWMQFVRTHFVLYYLHHHIWTIIGDIDQLLFLSSIVIHIHFKLTHCQNMNLLFISRPDWIL